MSGFLNTRAKKLEYNKTSFEQSYISFNKSEIPNNSNNFCIDLRISEHTNKPLDRQYTDFNSLFIKKFK